MAEIIKPAPLMHIGGPRASLTAIRTGKAVRFIIREGTIERAAIDVPLESIPGVIMGICKEAGIEVVDKGELRQ